MSHIHIDTAVLAFLFFASLLSTLALVPLAIRLAVRCGVVDLPGGRRAHSKATPRGGGAAVVLVYICLFAVFEYFFFETMCYSEKIILPLSIISAVSLCDDIYELAIPVRLVTHFMCSCLAVISFISGDIFLQNIFLAYAGFLICAVGLTGFLNIYNFLDGIDGITVSQSAHLSATILLIATLNADLIADSGFVIVTSVILLACSLGFWVFNKQPAKIFLGDVGAISLGFLLGICLLLIAITGPRFFIASIIASLYYLADGGITILVRMANQEKFWQPHLKHFFQQAVKNGMSHAEVVKYIAICNFFLMMLAVFTLSYPLISLPAAIVVVAITLRNFAYASDSVLPE